MVRPAANPVLWGETNGNTQEYGTKSLTEYQVPSLFALLPVRYALGWDQSRTPNIDGSRWITIQTGASENANRGSKIGKMPSGKSSPFLEVDSDGSAFPVPGGMHMTLRRLREGYLHVFSERDKVWRIYKDGDPSEPLKLIATDGLPPGTSLSDAKSSDVIKSIGGGVLLIPKDTIVWLGFADCRWTKRILDAAKADQSYRSKIMRRFDPKSWNKEQIPHAAPLGEVCKWVADMAPGMSRNACWYSSDPFRRMRAESSLPSIVYGKNASVQGAILALEDPAGVVMDLATSMEARREQWYDSPEPTLPNRSNEWMLLSYSGVDLLQIADANRIENQVFEDYRANVYTKGMNAPTVEDDWKFGAKSAQEFRLNVLPYLPPSESAQILERAKAARERSWASYKGLWNEDARTGWKKEHDRRRDQFELRVVWPIARCHVGWTGSKRYLNYFMCAFDPLDIGNGVSYVKTLTRCYAGDSGQASNCRGLGEAVERNHSP